MRDLERQIADWRSSMTQAAKHRLEALDELEAHLREEIDRLVQAGASPEEAFDLAAPRLGHPDALWAEFHKLENLRRSKWIPATLAQWACLAIAGACFVFLVPRIGHGRMTPLLATHVLTVTIGYSTMFIIGGLAICYVLAGWFHQTSPSQRYALRRTVFRLATISALFTAIGIVLGMFWARENWGRYWAWDPKETGGTLVLLCAAATVALGWFKRPNQNALIVMAILGNMATAWGWFGTNVGYNFGPLLAAFIVSHCLLLIAFLAIGMRRKEASN